MQIQKYGKYVRVYANRLDEARRHADSEGGSAENQIVQSIFAKYSI